MIDDERALIHARRCFIARKDARYNVRYKYPRPLINLQRCANHAIGGDRSSPLRRLPVWKISGISVAQVARTTVRAEVCALHCHRLCREILVRRCYCFVVYSSFFRFAQLEVLRIRWWSLNVQKFLYKVYSSYREKLGRGRVMVTAWQSTPPMRRMQWVVL